MAVDRDRLKWAESAPTEVASGRAGERAKAVMSIASANRVHRSKQASIMRTAEHRASASTDYRGSQSPA
jgi:hypothetical protein